MASLIHPGQAMMTVHPAGTVFTRDEIRLLLKWNCLSFDTIRPGKGCIVAVDTDRELKQLQSNQLATATCRQIIRGSALVMRDKESPV